MLARDGQAIAKLVPVRERRTLGAAKRSGIHVPDDLFLEPADPADLDAAEGKDTDEFGITHLPRK